MGQLTSNWRYSAQTLTPNDVGWLAIQCSSTVELFAWLRTLYSSGLLRNTRHVGRHSSTMEPHED